MTLHLDAKVLLAAVRKAVAAVEPYRKYDVLQCIRIEAADGKCVITSFNLSHEIVIPIPAEGQAAAFLVNVDMLSGWLSKVAGRGKVSVSPGDKQTVWRAGRAVASLPSPDIASWSTFSPVESELSCVCSGPALAEAVSSVLGAVQEDPSRLYLSGVRLEIGSVADPADAGHLVAVGTNGVMLIARDIAATGLAGSGGVILTIETAKAITRLVDGAETVSLSWNDRRVMLKIGDIRFQASLIEARFPPQWREPARSASSPHVTYDSADLVGALSAVTALAAEEGERKFRGVALTIGEDETLLRCADVASGVTGEDSCRHSLIAQPPRTDVSLAANQLLKMIGALGGETIQLAVGNDSEKPVVVLSVASKADRLALSVPLRSAS